MQRNIESTFLGNLCDFVLPNIISHRAAGQALPGHLEIISFRVLKGKHPICKLGLGAMLDFTLIRTAGATCNGSAHRAPHPFYIFPHASRRNTWDARGQLHAACGMPANQYTRYLACPRLRQKMPACQYTQYLACPRLRQRMPAHQYTQYLVCPRLKERGPRTSVHNTSRARGSNRGCLRTSKRNTWHARGSSRGCPRTSMRNFRHAAQAEDARAPVYAILGLPAAQAEDAHVPVYAILGMPSRHPNICACLGACSNRCTHARQAVINSMLFDCF